MQEFEGELVPKEISLKCSSFWIQIYNLPLICMISGSGHKIRSTIWEVIEVDMLDKGVQWGMYLRVRVSIDTTKKLVRGKTISIEGGEGRWMFFKYEQLPNFCYKCGMLDHGEKNAHRRNRGRTAAVGGVCSTDYG
nr:uncharacterized protein CFP56_61283 [Quercus suber]